MLKPPKALEDLWYQRLKDSGFEDIEDVSRGDRPLKSWQSWKFTDESRTQRRARDEEYQSSIETFQHRSDFGEICVLVVSHGHSEITAIEAQQVWELHCEGVTERKIAQRLKRSKTGIHKLLARLRSWMELA